MSRSSMANPDRAYLDFSDSYVGSRSPVCYYRKLPIWALIVVCNLGLSHTVVQYWKADCVLYLQIYSNSVSHIDRVKMVTRPRKLRRIVVCVDGTWFTPDGPQGRFATAAVTCSGWYYYLQIPNITILPTFSESSRSCKQPTVITRLGRIGKSFRSLNRYTILSITHWHEIGL